MARRRRQKFRVYNMSPPQAPKNIEYMLWARRRRRKFRVYIMSPPQAAKNLEYMLWARRRRRKFRVYNMSPPQALKISGGTCHSHTQARPRRRRGKFFWDTVVILEIFTIACYTLWYFLGGFAHLQCLARFSEELRALARFARALRLARLSRAFRTLARFARALRALAMPCKAFQGASRPCKPCASLAPCRPKRYSVGGGVL